MAGRVGNAETQDYIVEERRIGEVYSAFSEIISSQESQLVDARNEVVAGKRILRASILVRDALFENSPLAAADTVQLDDDAFGRLAVDRVEHVCG
jgi:hypothetical protein